MAAWMNFFGFTFRTNIHSGSLAFRAAITRTRNVLATIIAREWYG